MGSYTAIIKRDGDRWIGWVEEVPGVNGQERPVKSCWQAFASYWPKRSNSTAKKREQLLRAVLKKRPCRYEAARAAAALQQPWLRIASGGR